MQSSKELMQKFEKDISLKDPRNKIGFGSKKANNGTIKEDGKYQLHEFGMDNVRNSNVSYKQKKINEDPSYLQSNFFRRADLQNTLQRKSTNTGANSRMLKR